VLDCAPGEITGDQRVDLADLARLLAAYGSSAGQLRYDALADLDCDDRVELDDLTRLLADFGTNCAP